jgi:hypothetical protein
VWVFILFFCVVVHVFPYFSFNKRLIVLFNCFSVTRLFLYLLYMFPFLFSFAGGWRGGVAIATFSPRLSCYATCTRARPFPLFTWSLRRRARLKKTPVSVKRGHVFFLEIKKNMRVIAVSCRSVEGVQYAPLRNVSGAFWTTPARVISCGFWLVFFYLGTFYIWHEMTPMHFFSPKMKSGALQIHAGRIGRFRVGTNNLLVCHLHEC